MNQFEMAEPMSAERVGDIPIFGLGGTRGGGATP
jgi:hypothetical protein